MLWRTEAAWSEERSALIAYSEDEACCVFSPDETRLICKWSKGTLGVWDVSTCSLVHSYPIGDTLDSLHVLANGRIVALHGGGKISSMVLGESEVNVLSVVVSDFGEPERARVVRNRTGQPGLRIYFARSDAKGFSYQVCAYAF